MSYCEGLRWRLGSPGHMKDLNPGPGSHVPPAGLGATNPSARDQYRPPNWSAYGHSAGVVGWRRKQRSRLAAHGHPRK
eukprot:scaffold536_cov409-Prasinococcus_capsulatus_cf.AAC.16